jgi:hypothetical protein
MLLLLVVIIFAHQFLTAFTDPAYCIYLQVPLFAAVIDDLEMAE